MAHWKCVLGTYSVNEPFEVQFPYLFACIWVRILNVVQLAIFRPWALLLHLVRPQLLRNHFFWCRRKEYNQGFQETYTLYTFTRFCTSHGPPNANKWQKVMFLHFFMFLEPSCKCSMLHYWYYLTIVSIWYVLGLYHKKIVGLRATLWSQATVEVKKVIKKANVREHNVSASTTNFTLLRKQ